MDGYFGAGTSSAYLKYLKAYDRKASYSDGRLIVTSEEYQQMIDTLSPSSDFAPTPTPSSGTGTRIGVYTIVKGSDKTCTITGYHGSALTVNIPEKLDGCTVTAIGSHAFRDRSTFTTVLIPKNVTRIESYAFFNCDRLQFVNVANSVTSIGAGAFAGCDALVCIAVPKSVQVIASTSFANCPLLTLYLEQNSYASKYALHNKIPNYENTGEELAQMTKSPFEDGIMGLGGEFYALSANGTCAFSEYAGSATKVIIPLTMNGYRVTSIGSSAFQSNHKLVEIVISENVESIGSNAFRNCSKLTTVELHKTLRTIGVAAFQRCTALKSITLPNGLTTIGSLAFDECTSLQIVTIPESVTAIGSYAFNKCPELVLRVKRNSFAHQYALSNDLPCITY